MPATRDEERGEISHHLTQRQNGSSHPPSDPGPWVTNRFRYDEHAHSPGEGHTSDESNHVELNLGWIERLRHFTFAWFTLVMATGGVTHVLHQVPLRFTGLYEIGIMFLMINLIFFIFTCTMMTLRYVYWPEQFKAAFVHPTESLFVPAAVISIASVLINITEYGLSPAETGHWLSTTMVVLFWIYVVLAFITSIGIYLTIWNTHALTLAQMTPVWIFPAYPLLLVGPFAGILSDPKTGVSAGHAMAIIIGGVIVQGVGFMVSFMIYSAYVYRLMTQKLPIESLRPGMFVSVGPSGFTVSALISMGINVPDIISDDFMGNGQLTGQIVKILGFWAGLWLWGLAIWFFLVSVGAHWSTVHGNRLHFAMTFYAFIFPNTALITATFNVARALDDNYPIQVLGCVLACIIVVVWAFIVGLNIRAVAVKHILWPGQEDHDHNEWHHDLQRKPKRHTGHVQTDPTTIDMKSESRTTGGAPLIH